MRVRLAMAAAALLVVGASVAAASPGKGTTSSERFIDDTYQHGIIAILRHPAGRADRAFFDIVYPDRSGPACARDARRFQRSIEDTLAAIRALEPPAEVAALHARVVKNGALSVRTIRKATQEAAAGTLPCRHRMNDRIYGLPSTERAERGIEGIERHGYFIEGE